jgi:hypothetical protein
MSRDVGETALDFFVAMIPLGFCIMFGWAAWVSWLGPESLVSGLLALMFAKSTFVFGSSAIESLQSRRKS